MDMRSGLGDDHDLVFPGPPENPNLRESSSLWFYEESGAFGFPRHGIEIDGADWHRPRYDANFAFADGRVLRDTAFADHPSPIDAAGIPSIMAAGPMRFQCIEPFRKWRARYDGEAIDTNVAAQIAGTVDATRRIPVRYDVELTMASPAFVQNNSPEYLATLSPTALADAHSVGIGWRFEQMFRVEGSFAWGDETRDFKGQGSRIKRQSERAGGFLRGHCWQAAVFPDGRAFCSMVYPDHPDGSPGLNNVYLFKDGRVYPARTVRVPWLREIRPNGTDVSLTIESELGTILIEGTSALSTFKGLSVPARHAAGDLTATQNRMQFDHEQGGARYVWDGQVAYGMIERSTDVAQTSRP